VARPVNLDKRDLLDLQVWLAKEDRLDLLA